MNCRTRRLPAPVPPASALSTSVRARSGCGWVSCCLCGWDAPSASSLGADSGAFAPWPAAGVSAVDPRAGDVGAVGLGRGPGHRRPKDESVLCVLVSACGGHSGDGADPVKSLSAPASEIADDLDEAAADVGDSSLDAIADGLSATGDGEPIIDQIRRRNAG